MATLIRADRTEEIIQPAGKYFELDELYRLLECSTVEAIPLSGDRWMVMDEDGKYTTKPVSARATVLAKRAGIALNDFVVGDVLIVRQTPAGEWK